MVCISSCHIISCDGDTKYESPLLFTRLDLCMESSSDFAGTLIKFCLNIKFSNSIIVMSA